MTLAYIIVRYHLTNQNRVLLALSPGYTDVATAIQLRCHKEIVIHNRLIKVAKESQSGRKPILFADRAATGLVAQKIAISR